MGTITAEDQLAVNGGGVVDSARAGIVAGDLYFSRFSVPRRKGRRLVCGADEDAVTMAVEAAEGALEAWSGSPETVDGLFVALDYGPELAEANGQAVREALGISPRARVVTYASELGGLDALQGALAAVDAGLLGTVLVVSSEQAAGEGDRRSAGAAAMIVDRREAFDTGIALRERARASALTHTHWFDSELEPQEPDFRFFSHRYLMLAKALLTDLREQAAPAADVLLFEGGTAGDHQQVRAEYVAAVGGDPAVRDADGDDFGVAGPLIALLMAARAHPGRTVGLFAHGSGQMIFIEANLPQSEERPFGSHELPRVTKQLTVAPAEIGPALSLPAESPFFHRSWGETLRLEAARCSECGQVVYPHSMRPICSKCGGIEMEIFTLPRRGTVYSFIDNRFNPTGFPTRVISILGELEGGFRYWAPMPPEAEAEDLAIGQPIELHLRRFTSRHGLPVYAPKFVPVDASVAGGKSKGMN